MKNKFKKGVSKTLSALSWAWGKIWHLGLWMMIVIVPVAWVATSALGVAMYKVSAFIRSVQIPVAAVLTVVLFAGTFVVKCFKKCQPKNPKLRSVVMGFCKVPWVLRLIACVLIAGGGAFLMGFWTREVSNFISREMNITALMLSIGSYSLIRKKVPTFKSRDSEDVSHAKSQDPSASAPTMDDIDKEVQSTFNPDVGEDDSDMFEDDSDLC